MSIFKIAETFLSINGEGVKAGQLAFFVRFVGCNLHCDYCDTQWANQPDAAYTTMTEEDIYRKVKESGARNVTITGGEPMIQPHIAGLLDFLCRDPELYVEVETNGSVPLKEYLSRDIRPAFTMDYKLSASGMESFMCSENLSCLGKRDTVKFVCGSHEDLMRVQEITELYRLVGHTNVYLSPVYGAIAPADMVEFMKEQQLTGVTLQLQLHKFIWDPEKRGV